MPPLAESKEGSEIVMQALKAAKGADRTLVISGLHGSALNLCRSRHGHQVLCTLVETMPNSASEFIIRELRGHAAEVSCEKHGSAVIQALSCHCSPEQIA